MLFLSCLSGSDEHSLSLPHCHDFLSCLSGSDANGERITAREIFLSCLSGSDVRAPRKTSFPENPAYKNQRVTELILQKSGVFRGAREVKEYLGERIIF